MSRGVWLTVTVVALVAAVVAGVDRVVTIEADEAPTPAATEVQPVSGVVVCPVGDGREGTSLDVIAARPPMTGEQPASLDLEVFGDGERSVASVPRVFPESATTRRPSVDDDDEVVAATWRDGPVTLHREWVLDGDAGDLPPGLVAGGCTQPFALRWYLPGMVTSGGSQALLRIANPFPTDATVGVSFVGTDGPVAPLALRNLSVRGRSTLEIDVNEFLPERDDLTALVNVASGRVAVQGVQLVRSAIGGVDGATVLEAATAPAEQWTVPWVVDREGTASWLWVYNPGERVAPVELSYQTPDGGIVPDGLSEVLVEPGQLRRVDLRGTFPDEEQVVAVTARSDGAPIVVSAAVQLGADDVERTGFTVQLGSPATDRSWTVSAGATAGRVEQLHLVNPGSEAAVVNVSIFSGVTVDRPDAFQAIEVPAGARRVIEVADGATDLDSWTAFVTAESGELVVGRVGGAEQGARRHVTVLGVPSASWMTESPGAALVRGRGEVQRLRTSLGILAAEEIGTRAREVVTEPAEPDLDLDEPLEDAPDPDDAPEDDPLEGEPPLDEPLPGQDEPVEEPGDGELDEQPADAEDPDQDTTPGDLPGDGARAGVGSEEDDTLEADDG